MMKRLLYLFLLLPLWANAQKTNDTIPCTGCSVPLSGFVKSPTDTINRRVMMAFGGGKSIQVPAYSQMRAAIAGIPTATITGGTILALPTVGQSIATGTPDQVWNAMYRPPLAPTAGLSGGNNYQYSGSSVTHNLAWSYGRQATTATIVSADINPGTFHVFGSQPAQPGSVSGTQSVTTPANTNRTYTLTVTASAAPTTAVASTTDNWYPFLYVGTCAGTTPTSTEVLAATTKGLATQNSQVYNMNFTFTGTNLHVFYAYYSAYTTVTSVKDAAGNQAIAAMTLNSLSLTDNGFTGTWKTVTTNNTYSNANIVLSIQ